MLTQHNIGSRNTANVEPWSASVSLRSERTKGRRWNHVLI